MEEHKEALRYGFGLWPFSLTVAVGLVISSTGPTLVNSALRSLGSQIPVASIALASSLVLQAVGMVVAFAGVFGGLYSVLHDTE